MGHVRVRGSRLSSIATIAMVVLGILTLLEVSFDVGVALILVGLAMYVFSRWAERKLSQPMEES